MCEDVPSHATLPTLTTPRRAANLTSCLPFCYLTPLTTTDWNSQISKTLKDLRFSRRWLWSMAFSGMLRRVALVTTDVLEELSVSIIRETISEIGTLAVTSNWRTLRRNISSLWNDVFYSKLFIMPDDEQSHDSKWFWVLPSSQHLSIS
jgi:hypothetical protein